MDLMRYYSDIIEKYPTYVTQTELCEICKICAKTAYNLEQRGEISYTVEQNRLIRTHKIKLTDILEYLYKKECRQELDSPIHLCYERVLREAPNSLSRPSFCERCSKSYGLFFICCGGMDQPKYLKGVPTCKGYVIPKDFFVRILISPYYRRIKNKTPQRESLANL